MKHHNFTWDLNSIIQKGNQSNHQIEDFGLQLDHLLSQQDSLSPEMDELVNMTINLLHGLLDDDCDCECHEYH